MKISDVSHDMCVEPDQCPVVVPKEAGELLALPVVALMRSRAGCAPVFTWPVNDDGKICLSPRSVSGWFYDECGGTDVLAGLV